MRWILIASLLVSPGLALAAGGDTWGSGTTTKPPKSTKTTKKCKGAKIWDSEKQKCVNPQQSSLDQDTLYTAVRELAYAGRLKDAQGVLSVMDNQDDDRVLTYWGFTHRKLGNRDLAQAYYTRALVQNPDNILARSYMGQGYVEDGDIPAAIVQLSEIRMRGGAGTWAETSLVAALKTGQTYSY